MGNTLSAANCAEWIGRPGQARNEIAPFEEPLDIRYIKLYSQFVAELDLSQNTLGRWPKVPHRGIESSRAHF